MSRKVWVCVHSVHVCVCVCESLCERLLSVAMFVSAASQTQQQKHSDEGLHKEANYHAYVTSVQKEKTTFKLTLSWLAHLEHVRGETLQISVLRRFVLAKHSFMHRSRRLNLAVFKNKWWRSLACLHRWLQNRFKSNTNVKGMRCRTAALLLKLDEKKRDMKVKGGWMVATEVEVMVMVPSPHSQPCCYDNMKKKRHFICRFRTYTWVSVQTQLSSYRDHLHVNWIKSQ